MFRLSNFVLMGCPYFRFHHELSEVNGIIVRGRCPQLAHRSQNGIVRTKQFLHGLAFGRVWAGTWRLGAGPCSVLCERQGSEFPTQIVMNLGFDYCFELMWVGRWRHWWYELKKFVQCPGLFRWKTTSKHCFSYSPTLLPNSLQIKKFKCGLWFGCSVV
ncbi:hypothetical protein Hamer_G024407 [Homarus americanus]|uniref:Uncharacterized protein n=1 Tax=Homarus americanus TaxID=6706 RepID=A0A8J5MTE7_HOMAM|nr:hypothetical protein Hamer_G024407 [Homarus americanus]